MSTVHNSIVVFGATGRMGRRVAALSASVGAHTVAAVARNGSGALGTRVEGCESPVCAASEVRAGRVVIDFSSPHGVEEASALAERLGAALVSGTTGLTESAAERLRQASRRVAVMWSPNMSPGVAAVARAAAALARDLGSEYQAGIVEAHHRAKKDAPSGTALRLAEAVRRAGGDLPADRVLSLRGGDVVGEHTVRFAGPGECVEITHRATSRDLFALGALRAALRMVGRPPGWYSIEDVLGA